MPQSSDNWTVQLRGTEEQRELALRHLRELLLRRLQRVFVDRPDLSSALLEDIAQDTLIKIIQNLDSFEGRSLFTTWATSIAVRTAYSELRKRKWQDVSLDQFLHDNVVSSEVEVDKVSSNTTEADDKELVVALHKAIRERLSYRQQQAIMAELNGVPLEEIARQLGSNRNALYKLTHDARKRLKQGLEEMGYSSEDWHSVKS